MLYGSINNAEDFAHIAGGIQSLTSIIAVAIAGTWAYFRFFKQQDGLPHIQTSAEIKPICKHGDAWIIELIAVLENKAKWSTNSGTSCLI